MSAPIQSHFDLVDHDGRAVTETDFRGRFMLVYFGFTHCRVVCPRSLGKLSSVLDQLGERAGDIAALYVTVDPARDTPSVMKAYLELSFPRFLGLTGTAEQIEAAKAVFRIFAKPRPDAEDPDGYAVPHTAIAYLIDKEGEYLDHFTDALGEDQILGRLSRFLDKEP